MNRLVSNISNRMSLRPPQKESLEILVKVVELIGSQDNTDKDTILLKLSQTFPSVSDFERDFPSLCYALATGVGKTRLMGAFISFLYLARGVRNFLILAPSLTIYNKLITDFTPNTPKYVFSGISDFAVNPPKIITGENYESGMGVRENKGGFSTHIFKQQHLIDYDESPVHINIFNISKINAEVRGGKSPKIKRLSEYLGNSYFGYLAGLKDLVLIMDESHRYRASAGVRAINELKPILGLELTATPYVETSQGPIPFQNVIYQYSLSQAIKDGFVKEPAVATQKNFIRKNFTNEELETIKLKDGIRLHENTKVELTTYHYQTGKPLIKPFMLIIARDTTHAGLLMKLIKSDQFFSGAYKEKVIQVDSSKSGAEEDEMINRLLKVEKQDEPTEIVIHVSMLKEGWDVTNLYTIVPLRAANARVLIEQSIGRGLRLPFGKRTGVDALDRLTIVAHDKFQEIVDEANRPDSPVHMKTLILDDEARTSKTKTLVSCSNIEQVISIKSKREPNVCDFRFESDEEKEIAKATYDFILEKSTLPNSRKLYDLNIQEEIVAGVREHLSQSAIEYPGFRDEEILHSTVNKTIDLWLNQSIDIPRILMIPKERVSFVYEFFNLDCSNIYYQPVEQDILVQHLSTQKREILGLSKAEQRENKLEDYIVRGLVNFPDVSYDDHAGLLYDLAGQLVEHFGTYLDEESDIANVLQFYQRQLSEAIHTQMLQHQKYCPTEYETVVRNGYTELKRSAFTIREDDGLRDFRLPVREKSLISKYVFEGFMRCLYQYQKFHSDVERQLAVILDRETSKWFRPVQGQFQIFYKLQFEAHEYTPDFVAETREVIFMIEVKSSDKLKSDDTKEKAKVAKEWCDSATRFNLEHEHKPWRYLLLGEEVVNDTMSLDALVQLNHRLED